MNKVSDYFKYQRKKSGLRVYDYCKQLGISHTQLTKIENGYMDNPTPLLAARLCTILNIEPTNLCMFDNIDTSPDFLSLVEKKLDEQNGASPYKAIISFINNILKIDYPEDNYLFDLDKINTKNLESNLYEPKPYLIGENTTKNKRTVELYYLETRNIRKFQNGYESIIKNSPDFITILLEKLYPTETDKEIYILTTSKLLFYVIKNIFAHPITVQQNLSMDLYYFNIKDSSDFSSIQIIYNPKGK